MSLVGFVEVRRNSDDPLRQAIRESLDLIGYSFPSGTRHVAIKPNMCYYWDYSTGQTTDPKFVAALIDIIREEISPSVDIAIIESDASAMKCRYAFKYLGYEKMAKAHNVRLVNLSEDNSKNVEVIVGGQQFCFKMPHSIENADLLISLPKIKRMAQTRISCGLKNTYGCNPYPNKFEYHPKLDDVIVALNKAIRFNVYILDGIIVPGSHPSKLNLVMASHDPVALDAAACRIVGVNPKSVRHIRLAHKEGLGTASFISKGMDPGFFEKKYPKRKLTGKIMLSAYKLVTRMGLLRTEIT